MHLYVFNECIVYVLDHICDLITIIPLHRHPSSELLLSGINGNRRRVFTLQWCQRELNLSPLSEFRCFQIIANGNKLKQSTSNSHIRVPMKCNPITHAIKVWISLKNRFAPIRALIVENFLSTADSPALSPCWANSLKKNECPVICPMWVISQRSIKVKQTPNHPEWAQWEQHWLANPNTSVWALQS